MTAIAATVRTRRSLAVFGAIVAIALAVVALAVFKYSSANDMHHIVVSMSHHAPRFLLALFGAQHLGS